MQVQHSRVYQFSHFLLDATERTLAKDGQPIQLAPKAFDTLVVLVENKGRLVEKQDLMALVWQDAYVEENNLKRNIYLLRKALGEGDGIQYIETVPKHGYRFTAEVVDISVADTLVIIEKHSEAEIITEEEISTIDDLERKGTTIRKSLTGIASILPRPAAALLVTIAAGLALWGVLGGTRETSSQHSGETSRAALGANQPGFGTDGEVLTDFGFKVEKAQAVVCQPGGKIVVGGWVGSSLVTSDFAVAQYNLDGSLDASFHGDGKVVTALSERSDVINGLAVQSDGKIVAAGVTFNGPKTRRFAIVRYKTDGALDASFDGDGIVTMNLGTGLMDSAYAVAVQSDGKIVVAGSALMVVSSGSSRVNQNDFALLRLNSDGSPDTTFGVNGRVITDFGYGNDIGYAVALQQDGRIVVAGVATNGTDQDFALARYHSDGALDTGFGKDGKVRTDFFSEDDLISALTIQADGRIVVAGYAAKAMALDLALARYTDDGSPDNSFNGNGKLVVDISGNDVGRAVQLQSDDRIVVCVYSNHSIAPEFALACILPDGRLDQGFGDFGKARVPLYKQGEAFGMVLLPDGNAILAGSAGDNNSSDFALVRARL